MSKADDAAREVVALMRVLVDLGDYSREDLEALVEEALERENFDSNPLGFRFSPEEG